jgi:hypothetical protein
MKSTPRKSPDAADKPISYAGYRFPPEVISYAVWLYFRFPLSLRMVEEMLAARGIAATYETVRRWALKFGAGIARRIRVMGLARGDKWHLDEVVVTINGHKHWLWRAVDQHGATLDVLVQSRRDRHAPELCGSEPRAGARSGPPSAQGAEQPGREFAPTDSGQGEGHAPVQIGAAPAALCVDPRSGGQPVHPQSIQPGRGRQAGNSHPGLYGEHEELWGMALRAILAG